MVSQQCTSALIEAWDHVSRQGTELDIYAGCDHTPDCYPRYREADKNVLDFSYPLTRTAPLVPADGSGREFLSIETDVPPPSVTGGKPSRALPA